MFSYLLIEKDFEKFRYLVSTISEFDSELRLRYIALTGKESVNIIKSHNIEFIILDSNITDINYLDVLDIIENEKRYKNSVIVISDNESTFSKIEKYSCVNSIIREVHNEHILKDAIFNIIENDNK